MWQGFFQVRCIRDRRYLRPIFVSTVIMYLLVSSKESFYSTYLDAVELRFLCAKMIRKLSSINVQEPKVDIKILDTLTETQKRIS